ncbi:DUF2268 domain-containing putative Zn-dependent protease [Aquimarina gracilis]|uniref:DUF2268 domain-containing putative Zn-dependent protease n=1 Tax=Aquimarina gracilis TaxID=874422 RepID=A0ABU6A0T7_9FLAO|nr:DUF2268 domain-containing putative Zn-dependent protease [Aquimarina gracilis]MEB3347773.1 DUF2268 domain-containing putative Zn-dependent protease [Aquimarina gracilis]
MRKIQFLFLILGVFCLSCSPDIREQKTVFANKPENAKIIVTDIDLFWKSFDKLMKDTLTNPFESYIKYGSPGVQNFINDQRIVSAHELKKLVLSEKEYYQKVRPSTHNAKDFSKQIKASFYALEYLYPDAIFPPTYFLIGRTTSGGTASDAGLSIGIEIFSDNQISTEYGRPSLDLDLLPFLVSHEIIHFIQLDDKSDDSLLKHCIREGAADFIAEMIAGEQVKYCNGPNVYSYGEANLKRLLKEFDNNKNSSNLSPWLYSKTNDGRPQNLGYWIGYKIVESYYNHHPNKKKAIKEILNIKNYTKFYKQSKIENQIH